MGISVLEEDRQPELSAAEVVPITALRCGDSPRTSGEVAEHVRLLAEIYARLAPIIVHRRTMQVIDGMHRLRAAQMRGETTMTVRFFEGSEQDAFVIAVRENTAHGYPLCRKDRTAGAVRILKSHPHWSDRAVARTAGLSAKTVGALRRSLVEELPQVDARLGRDGRFRPVNQVEGRLNAVALMTANPNASLRRIAREAGISPRTVRDVRDRLRRGESPTPLRFQPAAAGQGHWPGAEPQPVVRPAPVIPGAAQSRSAAEQAGTVPAAAVVRRSGEAAADPAVGVVRRSGEAADDPVAAVARRPSSAAAVAEQVNLLATLMNDPALRQTERGRLLLRLLTSYDLLTRSRSDLVDNIPEHCADTVSLAARKCAETWLEFAEAVQRSTGKRNARR